MADGKHAVVLLLFALLAFAGVNAILLLKLLGRSDCLWLACHAILAHVFGQAASYALLAATNRRDGVLDWFV